MAMSDEELAALALAADPDRPPEPDAVPLDVYLSGFPGLAPPLPLWYMPPATARARGRRRWRLAVVVTLVAAFLLLDGFGLCNTYGVLGL